MVSKTRTNNVINTSLQRFVYNINKDCFFSLVSIVKVATFDLLLNKNVIEKNTLFRRNMLTSY